VRLRLLTVSQNELHARIFDHALNELGGRGGVHRDNDSAAQENSPKASDPFGGVWTPEKYAIAGDNPAPCERTTPEVGVGVKLCIRQLFPTVAASLDDSSIRSKAGKIREKTEKIPSGHRCNSFFASDMARFYP
jgi:hypothetical protein